MPGAHVRVREKLEKQAKKKGFRKERKARYVFGTLRKIGLLKQ